MSTYSRLSTATLALAACVSLAGVAPSSAQTRPMYGGEYESWHRHAYDEGYRAGLARGESDARARSTFDYRRDRDYQRADDGYRREMASLDSYRRVFRQGYEIGYEEGYRGDRNDRDVRYERPRSAPPVVVTGGVVRRTASSADVAFEYGFADGYKAGLEDRRDDDRFNPTDHDAYKDGDRGYERRYGARDGYRVDYRDGFHAGYTKGYREGR